MPLEKSDIKEEWVQLGTKCDHAVGKEMVVLVYTSHTNLQMSPAWKMDGRTCLAFGDHWIAPQRSSKSYNFTL